MDSNEKGFFKALFDISFSAFIVTKLIKVIYVLSIIFAAITALVILIGGAQEGGGTAVLALIGSPIVFFLYVIFARIWCEMIIVIFRIADHTGRLVEMKQEGTPQDTGGESDITER